MLALRLLYAMAVTAVAAGLLLAGLPLGAVVVVAGGIAVRRTVESGGLPRRPRHS